jgi:hypothetical protein
MQRIIILLFFNFVTFSVYSQSFLDAYKKFRLETISRKAKPKDHPKLKAYTNSIITELDTLFTSYKQKTGFNFNTADSLFLIYESPIESPFISEVIIWSGKDTISFAHELISFKPNKYKRIAKPKPYLIPLSPLPGFKEITERDSLVSLVAKKDFVTIMHLGDNQHILDGSIVSIYVATKISGKYEIKLCTPPQFVIQTTYRRE